MGFAVHIYKISVVFFFGLVCSFWSAYRNTIPTFFQAIDDWEKKSRFLSCPLAKVLLWASLVVVTHTNKDRKRRSTGWNACACLMLWHPLPFLHSMHLHVYCCTYTCAYVYMHANTCLLHTCICTYMHAGCMYAVFFAWAGDHLHIYIHVCVHIYIDRLHAHAKKTTYMYIYIHAGTCVH